MQEWTVNIVKENGTFMSSKNSFEVWPESIRGAIMKAENKIKKEMDGEWLVKSVWWLDPNRAKIRRGNEK